MSLSANRLPWLVLATLIGCTPTHDWRDVRPDGAAIAALFPCRPQHHMRTVGLAEYVTPMHLEVCSAAGLTFALGYLDVAAPANVHAALAALRAASSANLGARETATSPLQVPGMAASPGAVLVSLLGRSPQGAPVVAHVGLFTKGSRVYQATIFGASIEPAVSETFYSGLKLQ